jgi:mono/diheme cytochrome c family protein
MSDQDIHDLYAYLKAQPATSQPSRPHDLTIPFGWRLLIRGWKALYFTPGQSAMRPDQPAEIARGAYLVGTLSHCAECHTPRNFLGALDRHSWLAGASKGPFGDAAPNITPDSKTGIGDWTETDLLDLLQDGSTPDGDRVGGEMVSEVRNTTSHLTDADSKAIVRYLKSIPPVEHATTN